MNNIIQFTDYYTNFSKVNIEENTEVENQTLEIMEILVDNLINYGVIPDLYEEEILKIESLLVWILEE